jgi:hypothetical protein
MNFLQHILNRDKRLYRDIIYSICQFYSEKYIDGKFFKYITYKNSADLYSYNKNFFYMEYNCVENLLYGVYNVFNLIYYLNKEQRIELKNLLNEISSNVDFYMLKKGKYIYITLDNKFYIILENKNTKSNVDMHIRLNWMPPNYKKNINDNSKDFYIPLIYFGSLLIAYLFY